MTRRAKIAGRGTLVAAVVLVWLVPPAAGASLEEISVGPNGAGNTTSLSSFDAASVDGSRVIFETNEPLTPDDGDGNPDIYERTDGVTTRLSLGPNGGSGNNDVKFRGASDDAKHVFFETGEQIVAGDDDGRCHDEAELYNACTDVYERSGGVTTQVSTGPTASAGSFIAHFRGISKDGLHVFFSTAEQLVAGDTDTAVDVYERFGGTTRLVSTGPAGGNGDTDAYFKGCSGDGTRVFVETQDQLTSGDTDSEADIYERSGGTTTTLLSIGPTGGNGALGSSFKGSSADGLRVFFETDEQLTSGDTDSNTDVYQRSGGATTLLSTGPSGGNGPTDAFLAGVSKDGTYAWIETRESLVTGDTDGNQDTYQRTGATTTLVSTGPSGGSGAFDASFQGASDDGSRIWIGTFEHLAPTDTDSVFDVYERAGGTTTQVTLGPAGGNGPSDAYFSDALGNGSRVYLETDESLVSADTDAYFDVYQRYGGVTTLLSTGPNGSPATFSSFLGASDNGSRVFMETGDQLLSQDTDSQADVYASVDTGIYARPKGATPLSLPLVIAYRDCTSANTFHGAPLANPSCNPPIPSSDWLRVGTPDSNGLGVKSLGTVGLRTITGDSSTPADDADLKLQLSVTDVRRKSDLADYPGELQVRLAIRITDRLSGAAPIDPGTVQDIPFNYTGTCATTSDTTVGSTCTAETTADALLPGAIVEGKRTIWQVGTAEVWDGGSDGDVDSLPNTLFERQGIFVP